MKAEPGTIPCIGWCPADTLPHRHPFTKLAPSQTRMTEGQLHNAITGMCDLLGLNWMHVYDSRRQPPNCKGWPDLVIIGTRIIYRELKRQTESLEPDQRRWGSRILDAGGDWGTWRPGDLWSLDIEKKLREIS